MPDQSAKAPLAPESVAAAVNAALVILLPVILLAAGSMVLTNTSVTVRPPGAPVIGQSSWLLAQFVVGTLPFATLAGWRTWVYATRWQEQRRGSWLAVAEAGGGGLVVALVILAPGIVTRPMDAPPYLIAYGGFAVLVGLVVGLVLRTAALIVLRLHPGSQ